MLIQLTDAGVALIEAATEPVVVTSYKLGSDYGYIPNAADTDIHGSLVYTGTPSQPLTVNADLIKYGIALDYDVQTMDFGEVGYFVGTTLFALGVNSTLLHKLKQTTGTDGNAIRIDAYLSMVGTNYAMWGDIGATSNQWQAGTLSSVDRLPKSADAVPNFYIIQGATSQQSAFLGFTDRDGLWNFDQYAYANTQDVTILSATANTITIAYSDYNSDMLPLYFGSTFLEFISGQNYSLCRNIVSVGFNGTTSASFNLNSPLAVIPQPGDKIRIFARQALSVTSIVLPIASASQLGGIKVGSGLAVTVDGVLSVDASAIPVTSVNGQTGAVNLTATDIPGLAPVAISGSYNDLTNKPAQYTLPIATTGTLGGVRAPTSGRGIAISGSGVIDLNFDPVKSVNGLLPDPSTGNLVLPLPNPAIGLINPARIPNGADLNSYSTSGLFWIEAADLSTINSRPSVGLDDSVGASLEVVPLLGTGVAGDCIQRLMNNGNLYWRQLHGASWASWNRAIVNAAVPIATTSSLGGVIVGLGLNIDGTGLLKANVASVNGYTNTNIVLTAADVQAIPASDKGAEGGVAVLDANPSPTPNPGDDFIYGRLLAEQLTLGAWYNEGLWNANTNTVTARDGTTAVQVMAIKNGGIVTINDNFGGAGAPAPVDVDGNGITLRVSVAGTTSIDGVASWAVDDIVSSVNGKWIKVGSGAGGSALTYIKINSTGGSTTAAGTDAVAIGKGATGGSASGIALGINANAAASSTNGIAIGSGASCSGTSTSGIVIGVGAFLNTAGNGIAIGTTASATAAGAIAIGNTSVASVADTVSVGSGSIKRKIVNVANGAAANEVVTWDQVATTGARGLMQVGTGLGVAAGVVSLAPGGTTAQVVRGDGSVSNQVGGNLGIAAASQLGYQITYTGVVACMNYLTSASSLRWATTTGAFDPNSDKMYLDLSTGVLTATNFTASSDRRLKTIEGEYSLDDAMRLVMNTSAWRYTFNETGQKSFGWIADEVEPNAPELVHTDQDSEEKYQSVNYAGAVPALQTVVKHQVQQISNLQRDLHIMAGQMQYLLQRLEALEQLAK